MTSDSFVDCVNEFFADYKVQRLLDLARETRPLQVCFPREVPLSRFLAWILDPSQGHGLGDTPLRRLLTAAWRNRGDSVIDRRVRECISPATLANRSFSGCLIQTEVRLTPEKGAHGSVDVLVLSPKDQLLIAIENKSGSGERAGQLGKYSKALKSQYPGWTQVLVFLDLYGEAPGDRNWFGLDYEWLAEELAEAESSPWLGEDSRAAIREFKAAIELDGDAFAHVDVDDDMLLEVVQEHRAVLEQMASWQRSRQRLVELVDDVYEPSRAAHAKALQQLFPAYWQRRELWRICIPMLSYAGILAAARKEFPEVQQTPLRKVFFYSLPAWEWLEREQSSLLPVWVRVRILPLREDASESARFVVASFINVEAARDELEEPLLGLATELRKKYMKRNRKLKDEPGRVTLRVDKVKDEAGAAAKLIEHLRVIDQKLAGLHR